MKKSLMFATVLCGTLAAAPAMAEDVGADFHALSAMSSPVPVMTETQMASVEGGQVVFIIPPITDLSDGVLEVQFETIGRGGPFELPLIR